MFEFKQDRSKFPKKNLDGSNIIDLESGKFTKLWQGPQHPGMTGNMAVELTISGDEIVDLKTHVGYLHRGFEKLMERRRFIQCFPIVCRVCVPEPDFNEYCFAAAAEELSGIEVPDNGQWIRTLILEMARLQSYLAWIGGQSGTLGLGVVSQWTTYLRDFVLDRFEELTGGRIYHIYIIPGGVRNLLPTGFKERMRDTLDKIEEGFKDIEKVMFTNAVFKKRTVGVGYIDPKMVDEYGITGPVARAAGVMKDVRKDNPYLKYSELDFEPIGGTNSDIYERAQVRKKDLYLTMDLIRQILDKITDTGDFMAKVPNVLNWKIPKGETYKKAECTRGEYGYYMVTDGSGYPRRVNVRGPSYTHAITLLEKIGVDINLSDMSSLMVSLHTYPPEIER